MIIIKSKLFEEFGNLKFGFSTKIGLERNVPFYFNLSYSVGDDKTIVAENRKAFLEKFGLDEESTVFQKQVHGDGVTIIKNTGIFPESDALITAEKNIGLAVSSADCVPVFLYDSGNEIISAVHSGWRGTEKKILAKTLKILKEKFNSNPGNISAFIGPSISCENYRVGDEVAEKFDSQFIEEKDDGFYLDLKKANKNMLLEFGLTENRIEIPELCSFKKNDMLHSYRRDGLTSGRALGIIKMEK